MIDRQQRAYGRKAWYAASMIDDGDVESLSHLMYAQLHNEEEMLRFSHVSENLWKELNGQL